MTEPVARRVADFCAAYGVGRTTAYKLAAEGKIVMLRMGPLIFNNNRRWWQPHPRWYPRAALEGKP